MRAFLANSVDAIVVIDAGGLIRMFNPAAERMFGFAASDVVGRNVSLLMPSPYAEEHDGYLQRFFRSGDRKIIGIGREVEARRRDGSPFPVHLSVAEVSHAGTVFFTGVLRDLTAERASRARESDTARILETSVNEIFVFDAQSLRFVIANDSARSNLGHTMGELARMTPVDLMPEHDLESFTALIDPLKTGEQDRLRLHGRHVRKDASNYPVELQLQLGSFAGRPVFVAFVLDTTERDELQASLLHSQKLEAIGRLSGALAHDFNNLLMGVISGCRMIAARIQEDEAAASMLEEIQAEAKRGTGITRQLLDFSRKRTYDTTPCDLSAIVRGSERLFRNLLGEDVELVVRTESSGSEVLADPSKIDQILMNLVVNARDAMPDGGRLEIGVARLHVMTPTDELQPGPHLVLTVTDDGAGMTPEIQAHVFEPFFTTKPVGRGTGLGLSTVFGLTKEFRGHVELESAPGRGTTFRLYFPVAARQVPAASEEREPSHARHVSSEPASGGNEQILLVEDAPLVRAGIKSLLLGLGYRVHVASSPDQALEVLKDLPDLDLLLTDMVMPGMNGADLAEHVCRERPGVAVLFMSAYSDEALIEQGRLRAGVPVLEKPFEEKELAQRLRRVLDGGAA